MTEGEKISTRALRVGVAQYREDYHALSDRELAALLWAATSEHQRRHGDGPTLRYLAHLCCALPDMAREER